jgi:hypothetical protein
MQFGRKWCAAQEKRAAVAATEIPMATLRHLNRGPIDAEPGSLIA